MKLHLPVRLFRTVMALMLTATLTVPHAFAESETLHEEINGNVPSVKSVSEEEDSETYTVINYSHYPSLSFDNCSNTDLGGAIRLFISSEFVYDDIPVILSDNGSVTFNKNSVTPYIEDGYGRACGGAIGLDGNFPDYYPQTLIMRDNGSVAFNENSACFVDEGDYIEVIGGAIGADGGQSCLLYNNGNIIFEENFVIGSGKSKVWAIGGAIATNYLSLFNNMDVSFIGNTVSATTFHEAQAEGGAIICGNVSMQNNGDITFSGNKLGLSVVDSTSDLDLDFGGGAIDCENVSMQNNGNIIFGGNKISVDTVNFGYYSYNGGRWNGGGAIYCYENTVLTGNGDVIFGGNSVSFSYSAATQLDVIERPGCVAGGAILERSGSVILSENRDVVFSENTVSASGNGVIAAYGGAIAQIGKSISLCIENNLSVLFEKNAEICNGDYRLRSIYLEAVGYDYAVEGTTCSVAFSALKGNTIEFRDSIFIASAEDTSVIFNGDLNGDGGDIIFTGASTETDLRALKGSAGTASEILNSRTSEVQSLTQLCGGRLCVEDGAIYKGYGITAIAGSQATVRLKDATLSHKGYNLTFNAGTTLDLVGVNVAESQQMLMMDGSVWSFEVSADNEDNALLSYSGSLTLGGRLDIQITGSDELEYGEYKLMTVQGTAVIGWDDANISINGGDISTSDVEWVRGTLYFSYTGQDLSTPGEDPDEPIDPNEPISPENPKPLQPVEPSNSVLTGGFIDEKYEVILNNKGNIVLEGEVNAGAITVESDKNITLKIKKKNPGALVGDGDLTKSGLGTLTLNDGNVNWTGDIYLKTGTIKVSGATSMGLGDVYVQGGALDLKSKAVSNDIVLEGSAAVKGGKKYEGEFTMNGGELLKGSLINVAEDATLKGGVVNGTLSGVGTVAVSGEVTLGASGKITTNALEIDGALSVSAKGLVMNSKASAISIDGGTLSSAGKISAYSMNMTGGTLDVTNAKPMGITLKDAFVATAGADIDLYGALTANQLTLEGVDFTLAMDDADIAPKVQPKAQSITLKGKGVLNTISDSELDIAGNVSVTGDLALLDSVVMLHDVAGAAKPKAQGLTVKGVLISDGTELVTTGAVSAAALTASESVIAIAAEEGLAAQSLKLTRKDVTKGVPQENILSDSVVYVNGSMSVAGNLQLQESYMMLRDYSGKNKAMGLSVKGDLVLNGGSVLNLTGSLSAKNLTLGSGSSLTLGFTKLSTVKVGGALTLGGEISLDLGFTVTEKDVAKGKEYTLFTFKSLVGDVSNLTLGYEGEYTLALNTKETAIILTVTDAAAWNAYVADIQESLNAAPAVADAVDTPEEEVEAEELLLKPVAATTDIDPLLAKAADTLVQSTWGTVGASRAFGEMIASRGRNATLLGEEGKGAAWLSVMGGSSRISSADGHNGADFTLSGAAFGVEGRVGEKSTLGVAIGNSWGKVSTFSAFPVDQDSMHVGIYGNHTLSKSLTLSWMATHTRTESEATILGAPYSWSQDALQLDARLTWGKSISDKTAVSAFAGLQYLATDSGECAGIKTGSLQNLRAELGVGASHKCSESTMVFGELSFIGDMVRNNPTAAIGDYRTHGTNPGRVGLNLSVGAQHQLSEDWSLNASYSLELMENSTSHSLNVGASYSF